MHGRESEDHDALVSFVCLAKKVSVSNSSRDATTTSQWILGVQAFKFNLSNLKKTMYATQTGSYLLRLDGLWRLLASLLETLIHRQCRRAAHLPLKGSCLSCLDII